MRKILFLDVDGVLNSEQTLRKSNRVGGDIDPYMVLLVHRIIEATKCEVVLSSSWRHTEHSRNEIMKAVPFVDITPNCCTGIRGCEIYSWINRNIDHKERDTSFRYAILDDDSDMLLWQKDHFFQTSFKTGLTEDIVDRVIKHLNS